MLKDITAPTIVTCVQQEAAARKAAAFFDIYRTRDFNIRNIGSNIHAANVRRTKKDESPYSVSNAIRTLVMVPAVGLEPTRVAPTDFESVTSAIPSRRRILK